jgi:hypothetical protein
MANRGLSRSAWPITRLRDARVHVDARRMSTSYLTNAKAPVRRR